MINPQYFQQDVIRPTLKAIDLWTSSAELVILATAIHESGLKTRRQIGGGPALGLLQIEPATHDDIWLTYLNYAKRRDLVRKILQVSKLSFPPPASELINNDPYSVCIARVKYLRSPVPLPRPKIDAIAAYWGKWYQGTSDPKKIRDFVNDWSAVFAVEPEAIADL